MGLRERLRARPGMRFRVTRQFATLRQINRAGGGLIHLRHPSEGNFTMPRSVDLEAVIDRIAERYSDVRSKAHRAYHRRYAERLHGRTRVAPSMVRLEAVSRPNPS